MNWKKVIPLAFGLAVLAATAQAGPPLICHPIEIGAAQSLPWVNDTWRTAKTDYDTGRLVADTEALLTPETPVIVRMETLRRAAIWAHKDTRVAYELLSRLMGRALQAEMKGKPDALALFDVGYLVECYKQAGLMDRQTKLDPQLDGYTLVSKALNLRNHDAEMQFAAALITVYDPSIRGPHRNHQEHLRKAVDGAMEGTLLARNLVDRFGGRGARTVAELRAKW